MRLTLEQALQRIGRMLSDRIAPDVANDFVAQSARLSSGMLNICANWIDDAAEVRVKENAAIRGLLSEIAGVAGGAMSDGLAQAARSSDPGLRISQLDAESHRLRLLLVEAHAWLETQADEPARNLDRKVWQLLEDIELARAPRE